MQPTTLIIFGASGDLTARKLLPAVYELLSEGQLPEGFQVLAVARREITPESLLVGMQQHMTSVDREILERLRDRITAVRMDSNIPEEYAKMREALSAIEGGITSARRIFYLSVPPAVSMPIVDAMATAGVGQETAAQVLLEKPFGYDKKSAEKLERHLHAVFDESQIYRVDHYLAKAAVQPLSSRRMQTISSRTEWNKDHIQRIEIVAREKIGVEGRADFYEQTGALRDLIQSHLVELMAAVMMDEPESIEGVQKKRAAVLAQTKLAGSVSESTLRGQYVGYAEQVKNPTSSTETFTAVQLVVENERWSDVPVTLVTGKALEAKRTEIRLHHKNGIRTVLDLNQSHEQEPDGYQRVIMEALRQHRANFVSGDEVMASWQIFDQVLIGWQQGAAPMQPYEPGSTGPPLWS